MATSTKQFTASVLNIDRAALTIDVIDGLAALSNEGWLIQLVLVDNGSQPDQLRALHDWVTANRNRFEEVVFVSASKNLGVTGGRNLALQLASKDRILILDNDVVLPADSAWLENLWRRMDGEAQTGIVAPMLVSAEAPDTVQATGIALTKQGRVGYINRGREATSVASSPIEVVAAPAACWLLRREAQQAVGLFSDLYYPMQYEDVDLCIRLHLAGWKIVCDPAVRIRHMEHVTTKNLDDHSFARLTVRSGVSFKDKWADVLPTIATITHEEISWNP